jgi:hypothetical protein
VGTIDPTNDRSTSAMLRRLPPTLYRYSGVSGDRMKYLRRTLVDSYLYFAPSRQFNDPFDCRISPRFDSNSLKIEQHWREFLKKRPAFGKVANHKKRIAELTAKGHTAHGRKELCELLFDSAQSHGIACFTPDALSTLMWSYYSEGHHGVVLRFNMALAHLVKIPDFLAIEIEYVEAFPRIQFYEIDRAELVVAMLGAKAHAWKHEKEWRLVTTNRKGEIKIPPEMVDAVILGLDVTPECEQHIRDWIALRSVHTEVFRIKNLPDSFDLQIVPA